jgi:heat shock protein HspQ
MRRSEAKFHVGQLVRHQLFDYRGVIVDVDMTFQGTDEWYERMAQTRPPKDEPWYHVLVHNAGHRTYVAERNLGPDETGGPINHPEVGEHFSHLEEDRYVPRVRRN